MKKIKVIMCTLVLITGLVCNVFAGNTTGGSGVFSFFENAVNAVVSMIFGSDDCEGRICTNCKPNSADGDNNCRPTDH